MVWSLLFWRIPTCTGISEHGIYLQAKPLMRLHTSKQVLIKIQEPLGKKQGDIYSWSDLRPKRQGRLDRDAFTPNELYLAFELDYFVNELTVHYKDGTSKNIVHIAGYIVSVL